MKELLSLLNNIHSLSPALHLYLSQNLKSTNIEKKQFLLQAGQINRHIYFIKKGLLRCYYIHDEQEVCSKFLKEGDIIVSATSFFLQKESHEFIQAIENSTLWYICYDELQHIYRHYPEFNVIARVLSIKSYLLSEQRLNFLRTKQAADRYSSMLEHFPELVLRVPSKYLASYLSISVETLSRIRGNKY
ncbi:MAG TPA: Crp/Fnr family transcriptional regulator [Chitinophagaceae bacterium]|jgi:CRP-like cAMP-binding protein|nr:Crp/Fnr family transcriptional regulator [Chitinophagaceae bacterium]